MKEAKIHNNVFQYYFLLILIFILSFACLTRVCYSFICLYAGYICVYTYMALFLREKNPLLVPDSVQCGTVSPPLKTVCFNITKWHFKETYGLVLNPFPYSKACYRLIECLCNHEEMSFHMTKRVTVIPCPESPPSLKLISLGRPTRSSFLFLVGAQLCSQE